MKVINILNISLIVFIILLSPNHVKCQTISLDKIYITIGDSHEQTIKKFNEPPYYFSVDTLQYFLRYNIYKETAPHANNSNIQVRIIGHLYFDYIRTSIPINYTKELFMIDKVWSNVYTNDVNSILKIINNVIEKNAIDKYSTGLSCAQNIEPDYSTNTITIKINTFTLLEIYFRDDGYYEIAEVITKDESIFSDEEYILIFEDSRNLIGKQNYIMEIFKKEEDAERRCRVLKQPYLIKGLELPNNQIIRFTKRHIYDFQ